MALVGSGTLYLGTAGSTTTTIKYEIEGSYGAYGLLEADTDSGGQGKSMSDYYGYSFPTVPTAPSDCAAVFNAGCYMDITWTDNSSDETNFRLESNEDGAGWFFNQTLGANVTAALDENPVEGASVQYRVRAYNAAGDSAWSTSGLADMEVCT